VSAEIRVLFGMRKLTIEVTAVNAFFALFFERALARRQPVIPLRCCHRFTLAYRLRR
jgi:hypothetical protein